MSSKLIFMWILLSMIQYFSCVRCWYCLKNINSFQRGLRSRSLAEYNIGAKIQICLIRWQNWRNMWMTPYQLFAFICYCDLVIFEFVPIQIHYVDWITYLCCGFTMVLSLPKNKKTARWTIFHPYFGNIRIIHQQKPIIGWTIFSGKISKL